MNWFEINKKTCCCKNKVTINNKTCVYCNKIINSKCLKELIKNSFISKEEMNEICREAELIK